jgi:hypothetical protein
VFAHENEKLCVLASPTLEEVMERIDVFKSLAPMNRNLILLIYGSEKAFYINKDRKNPLERRIRRFDNGMGNIVDMSSLAIDMEFTPNEGDLSEQLYQNLYYNALVYAKGAKVARKEMDKFIKSDKKRLTNELSFYKSLT